jgi:hypothetical protein
MVTNEKMWHEVTQNDIDDQSWMLLFALSNNARDIIVNSFNVANDASLLSRYH